MSLASLTSELALARESVARRLAGVDPSDIAAQRHAYDAFAENDALPDGCTSQTLELGGVPAIGVVPKGARNDTLILWLHGGGFTMGSSVSHRGLAAQVAGHAGAPAVVIDYRLAPEHPYPAAVEDAVAAYTGALEDGMSASRMIVAGDSAGGGLAVLMLMKLRERGAAMPAALMLLSPWINFANEGWSWEAKKDRDPFLTKRGMDQRTQSFLGSKSPTDADVAILDADLRGFPPTLIQVGEAELLMSDSVSLAERLGACGAPMTLEIWPDMFHVWQARYPVLSQARSAVQRLGTWAAAQLTA